MAEKDTSFAGASLSNAPRGTPLDPVILHVEYQRLNSFFSDYINNIRRGVTFIETERVLPIGTVFLFRLQLPIRGEPLEIRGGVRWVVDAEKASAQKKAGMGIEFEFASDEEREILRTTIEKIMTDSLGPLLVQKLLR